MHTQHSYIVHILSVSKTKINTSNNFHSIVESLEGPPMGKCQERYKQQLENNRLKSSSRMNSGFKEQRKKNSSTSEENRWGGSTCGATKLARERWEPPPDMAKPNISEATSTPPLSSLFLYFYFHNSSNLPPCIFPEVIISIESPSPVQKGGYGIAFA